MIKFNLPSLDTWNPMKEEQSIDEIIVNAVNKGKKIFYISNQDFR